MSELNQKATLGRVLFYERRLSLNSSVACASCHQQDAAFSDKVAFSRGFENKLTRRNSMPIQNLGFSTGGVIFNPFQSNGAFFWDARETNLKDLISRPITNHVEMGIDDVSELPTRLVGLPYYQDLFKKAYGSEEITVDKIADAMTIFLVAIRAENTRFDQVNQGLGSYNALELEGQRLFNTKYDCASCHQLFPQAYSSAQFMNIGLEFPNVDKGMGAVTNNAQLNGMFKIPNLRNVALTAPYMHDGRFATLDDVLEHYSHGIQDDPNLDERLRATTGQPLRMNISDNEKTAIIAFLNTLTDYSMITDEKYSDPFKLK
jgi:cytochrome c peroxidase